MESNIAKIFCFLFFGAFLISTLAQEKQFFSPVEYDLTINTAEAHFKDENKIDFEGQVLIILNKKNEDVTKLDKIQVKLNADSKMKVTDAKLTGVKEDKGENKIEVKGALIGEEIVFNLTKADYLGGKDFKINVTYSAPFGKDMTGFYRSFYQESDQKRWLLTSHFEPIYARKAFPCFDKPNLKANFIVKVSVPKNMEKYHVLSNTPCTKKTTREDKTVFECEKTPTRISTYLVAFTVSDFMDTGEIEFESDYNPTLPKKRKLKTYGQKNLVKLGNLSQKAAEQALNNLKKYLKIGYAYKKLDQIGIPDFTAGAMENWGLISYRENKLFFDEKSASKITLQGNILTITHEVVHQWFGNLVTPKTWDNIWLNEAFATYLQYLIGSQCKTPDTEKWEYLKQLVVNEIHLRAFEADGVISSKALSHPINDENLIFSYFNDISYSKGAAVLRMWDLSLKTDQFKNGLNKYLDDRKENSSQPADLYKALTPMDEKFFENWVNHPGYPVVEVTKDKEKNTYVLTQSRFLWEKSNDSLLYTLPITYATDKNIKEWKPDVLKFLSVESEKLTGVDGRWIILNKEQAGYYRVNYEKDNWLSLSRELKNNCNIIPELNRAQIINDAFSLARSLQKDYIEYKTVIDLSQYLEKEESLFPWKTALNAFGFLQTKLYKDQKLYQGFKNHLSKLMKPHIKDLSLQGLKDHIPILKAVEISRWACSLDFEPCVKNALDLYKNGTALPPDTEEIILCTVVRHMKNETENILKKYKSTSDTSRKIIYLSALGCAVDEKFLKNYLDKTLAEKPDIRPQDYFYVLSSVYNGNLNNVKTAFDFVKVNYKKIETNYGGVNSLGKALIGIAKKLDSETELKEMETLGNKVKKECPSAKESVDTALSIIQSNIHWINKKKPEFIPIFSAGSLATYSFALLSVCLAFIFKF